MGLPDGHYASKEGSVFEALSIEPDRLNLDAFLYGIAHQVHLASEVFIQFLFQYNILYKPDN